MNVDKYLHSPKTRLVFLASKAVPFFIARFLNRKVLRIHSFKPLASMFFSIISFCPLRYAFEPATAKILPLLELFHRSSFLRPQTIVIYSSYELFYRLQACNITCVIAFATFYMFFHMLCVTFSFQ